MNPIYIIVGPPAVGKSSTSRALATHFPKSIHIPVDDVRDMVVSGLVLPGAAWSTELTQQVRLARASVITMALNYHKAGFTVVIDDFWDPNHLADYQSFLDQPQVYKILLYPNQMEAHQRNLMRSGESPARAYIDGGIQLVYQQLSAVIPQLAGEGWLIVDSTTLSVDEVVEAILQHSKAQP